MARPALDLSKSRFPFETTASANRKGIGHELAFSLGWQADTTGRESVCWPSSSTSILLQNGSLDDEGLCEEIASFARGAGGMYFEILKSTFVTIRTGRGDPNI